jgi:hypothetical protein
MITIPTTTPIIIFVELESGGVVVFVEGVLVFDVGDVLFDPEVDVALDPDVDVAFVDPDVDVAFVDPELVVVFDVVDPDVDVEFDPDVEVELDVDVAEGDVDVANNIGLPVAIYVKLTLFTLITLPGGNQVTPLSILILFELTPEPRNIVLFPMTKFCPSGISTKIFELLGILDVSTTLLPLLSIWVVIDVNGNVVLTLGFIVE